MCAFWNEWGDWSACGRSCNGGNRNRIRRCFNGIPGDEGCEGSDVETEECGTEVSEKIFFEQKLFLN